MNPALKCCTNFVSSWVDKVTTGAKSFISVIAKFAALSPCQLILVNWICRASYNKINFTIDWGHFMDSAKVNQVF